MAVTRKPTTIRNSAPGRKPPKWLWLEEYKHCGCSNLTETKCDALTYCPAHGTDRRRIIKIPNNGMELGYVRIG